MKKVFPIQLDSELHKQMKHASLDAGETLHEWVLKAIERRLQEKHIPNEKNCEQKKSGHPAKNKKN